MSALHGAVDEVAAEGEAAEECEVVVEELEEVAGEDSEEARLGADFPAEDVRPDDLAGAVAVVPVGVAPVSQTAGLLLVLGAVAGVAQAGGEWRVIVPVSAAVVGL